MTAELSPDDLAELREIVSKLRSLNNTPEESLLIATVVRLLDEVERLRGEWRMFICDGCGRYVKKLPCECGSRTGSAGVWAKDEAPSVSEGGKG